jgi:hypothetical protein
MKRIAMVIGAVSMLPFLMGAGGGNPGIPFGTKIAGQTYKAYVVIDAHETGATSTAKQASIRVGRDPHNAAAIFKVPDLFPFALGCDLTKTNGRFLNQPLLNWIPENVLDELFDQLGVPRSPTNEPVITRIQAAECTPDANNPTTADGSAPGILSFQADVRFLVPR